jgi:transcriptional regulator with XRE-family HTH domain
MLQNAIMDTIQKLKVYRLKNRISQQGLAKELQVAYSTVNRWLTGKTKPNEIQSYHIEELLSVSEGKSEYRTTKKKSAV